MGRKRKVKAVIVPEPSKEIALVNPEYVTKADLDAYFNQPAPRPKVSPWLTMFGIIILVAGLVSGLTLVGFSLMQPKEVLTPIAVVTSTPVPTNTPTPTSTSTPTATPIPKYQVVWDYYSYIRIGDYSRAEACLSKDMNNRVGGAEEIMHKAVETGPVTPMKIVSEFEDATKVQVLVQLYFSEEGRYRWYRFQLVYDAYLRRWQIATIQNYEAWATPEG